MSASYQYTFTVFTPTYNRAHTLHRVYDSLKAQTSSDFEWLIVDDGSTDNTRELVEQWQKEANFPVRYYWQENQRKHIAINRGVREAKGELFLIHDADDACVPHALEYLEYYWDLIPSERKQQFSGVTCLCQDTTGKIVGTPFPSSPTDSDSLEIRYRYKVVGEKWGFHRTDILREFTFPELPVKYLPEGLVWNKIATRYKTRFVNEPLRIYHQDAGDQITHQSVIELAPVRTYYADFLNEHIGWWVCDPKSFLFEAIIYSRFSFLCDDSLLTQAGRLGNPMARFLWTLGVLPGYLLSRRDLWNAQRKIWT